MFNECSAVHLHLNALQVIRECGANHLFAYPLIFGAPTVIEKYVCLNVYKVLKFIPKFVSAIVFKAVICTVSSVLYVLS